MSKTNDGGAAFPGVFTDSYGVVRTDAGGLSLRDYFAAKALNGLLSDAESIAAMRERFAPNFAERLAAAAYSFADAMLAERAQ